MTDNLLRLGHWFRFISGFMVMSSFVPMPVLMTSSHWCAVAANDTLGFVDAFVYAFNHQRHNRADFGQFEDCMQSRILSVTALARACAHVCQKFCLGRGL